MLEWWVQLKVRVNSHYLNSSRSCGEFNLIRVNSWNSWRFFIFLLATNSTKTIAAIWMSSVCNTIFHSLSDRCLTRTFDCTLEWFFICVGKFRNIALGNSLRGGLPASLDFAGRLSSHRRHGGCRLSEQPSTDRSSRLL